MPSLHRAGQGCGGAVNKERLQGDRATSIVFMGMPLWLDIFVVPLTCGLLVDKNV